MYCLFTFCLRPICIVLLKLRFFVSDSCLFTLQNGCTLTQKGSILSNFQLKIKIEKNLLDF